METIHGPPTRRPTLASSWDAAFGALAQSLRLTPEGLGARDADWEELLAPPLEYLTPLPAPPPPSTPRRLSPPPAFRNPRAPTPRRDRPPAPAPTLPDWVLALLRTPPQTPRAVPPPPLAFRGSPPPPRPPPEFARRTPTPPLEYLAPLPRRP
mgnify:CR=1 FL=1